MAVELRAARSIRNEVRNLISRSVRAKLTIVEKIHRVRFENDDERRFTREIARA